MISWSIAHENIDSISSCLIISQWGTQTCLMLYFWIISDLIYFMMLLMLNHFLFGQKFKRRKRRKLEASEDLNSAINACSLDGEIFLNFWFFWVTRKKKEILEQTDPPSISVIDLFPSGDFPEGEIQQYKDE